MPEIRKVLICIILPDFNLMDRYSAVSAVVYSFADLLRKNGYEITVNDRELESWEKEFVSTSTVYLPITRYGFIKYFPKRFREFIKDLLFLRKNRRLYRSISTQKKPDVVLGWITMGNSYPADLAKHWSVPLVSIFDNPLVEEYTYLKGFPPFFKKLINQHEKRVLVNSEAVVVYSQAVKTHLQKVHGLASKFYFKAFTDFKRMSYLNATRETKEINFVYIGSFFNWHQIDDLIEAYSELHKTYLNARLYLVGDGPEFKRIKQLVQQTDIIMTGKLDGKELQALMKNMHVGVIPNALWFQAPVKLFQYSAAGLAVISKATPTIRELTSDQPCYSFFKNVEELKQQMEGFLKNPDKIEAKSKEAQEYIRGNFSENNYMDLFNEIFRSL